MDASANELQVEVHTPPTEFEHSLLTQSAPVEQERPLTLRHVPLGDSAWPGGQPQELAVGSHPPDEPAGHAHELEPTDDVVDPPPHATHGALPVAPLKYPTAHEQPPAPSGTDPAGHEVTQTDVELVLLTCAQRPVAHWSRPPWQARPAESRQREPPEPGGCSVPAGHWHVLDAASQTDPMGCEQVQYVGP